MKTKLKLITLALAGIVTLGAVLTPSVFAADPCASNLPAAVREANGCSSSATSGTLQDTIRGILNAVILISGLVAVGFIIAGGIQYTTSLGDAGKIKKAKDTILYALIGVIVCALSYALVNWVIFTALGSGNNNNNTADPSTNPTSFQSLDIHTY